MSEPSDEVKAVLNSIAIILTERPERPKKEKKEKPTDDGNKEKVDWKQFRD